MHRYAITLLALAAVCASTSASNGAMTVLMVTENDGSLSFEEQARVTLLSSWGYTIDTVWANAAQGTIDAAVATSDVVYVTTEASAAQLTTKLRTADKGVVSENAALDVDFGFATQGGTSNSGTTIAITNNSHDLTKAFGLGGLTIFSPSDYRTEMRGTAALGFTPLASNGDLAVVMGAVEKGGGLANNVGGNVVASERRVRLPWGDAGFEFSKLTADSRTLLQKSLEWASGYKSALLHWRFDETTGSTADDSSSFERDGALTGSTAWVDGRRRGALDVTAGAKSEVNSLLGEPSSFTVSAWVDVDAVGSNGGIAVSVGDHIALIMDEPHLNGGKPAIAFNYTAAGFRYASGGTPATGAGWRHYVGVFNDDDNTLKMYVNGELVSNVTTVSSIDWAATLGTTTVVGRTSYPIGGYELDGRVDDAQIYGRALSEEEIALLYGEVGHWKLDDPSGTTAVDSSLAANNGAYTGGATLNQEGPYPGKGAVAATFDGSSGYVSVPNESHYDITDEVTVAAWFKVDAFTENYQTLVSKSDNSWRLSRNLNTDTLHFACNGLTAPHLYGNININDGRWHHAVGVYDGSEIKLYVDGVLDVSAPSTGTISTNDDEVQIGRNASNGRNWNGGLYDVRLYNRGLSEAEVIELYGLVSHWKLDEPSGGIAYDATPSGNDATLNGAEGWTSGISDGGHQSNPSDGEDDYFEAPSSDALNNVQADDYTVMAFFRPNSTPAGSGSANDANYAILIKQGWHGGLYYTNSQKFEFTHFLAGNIWKGASTTATSAPGKYYHVAATVNRTEGVTTLYVDGEEVGSTSFSPGAEGKDYGATPWRIGIALPGASNWRWAADGDIDDARIYNRVVSADDIAKIASSGLSGHWRLDETSGTTAFDASPSKADGDYVNSPTLSVPAVHDTGVSFNDGALGQRLDLPYEVLNGKRYASIAWWMKTTKTGSQAVLSGNRDGKDNSFLLFFNNHERFSFYMDGSDINFPIDRISDSRWRHFTFTYNGVDGASRLYIDGTLVGEQFHPVKKAIALSEGGLVVAQEQDSVGGGFVDAQAVVGTLDDIRIYGYELSDSEIKVLHGMIGHWTFDEGTGYDVADSSGAGNHAAFSTGTPAWVPGARGMALEFDGTNDVATLESFTPPESGAISMWMRRNGPPTSRERPWGLGGDYEMWQDTDGLVSMDVSVDGYQGGFITTESLTHKNRWYHVLSQYSSDDDSYEIYIDGELHKSGISTRDIKQQAANVLSFGARTGSSQRFVGALDDFRVYNRKLLPEEIADLNGLIGHWKLDEAGGAIAVDSSGAGRDGTYLGTPTLGAAGPKLGELAANFDGDDDVVLLPSINQDFSDGVAMSLWARPTASNNSAKFLQLSRGTSREIDLGRSGTSPNLRGIANDGSDYIIDGAIHDNVWRHYVMSMDSTGLMKLYRNGSVVGEEYRTPPPAGLRDTNWIGGSSWGADELFEGEMRDVRLYNRPVNEEEARALFYGEYLNGLRIVKWRETANPTP